MYTKDDIMARLKKGDDPQAIANEIADNLNAALKDYEDQKAANQKKEQKKADMRALSNQFSKYMRTYYDWDEEDMTDEEVEELMDGIEAAVTAMTEIKSALKSLAADLSQVDEDMDEQPAKLKHEEIPRTTTKSVPKCNCSAKVEHIDIDAELHRILNEMFGK